MHIVAQSVILLNSYSFVFALFLLTALNNLPIVLNYDIMSSSLFQNEFTIIIKSFHCTLSNTLAKCRQPKQEFQRTNQNENRTVAHGIDCYN